MVQHERVGGRRVVAPQPDLRGELHVAIRVARELHAEPRGEIRDARAREHRVGVERDDALGEIARAPHRGALPRVHRARRGRAGTPARRSCHESGAALARSACDALGTELLDPLLLRLDVEHPSLDPRVVVVAPGRGAGLDPEVVVLAVAVDRQRRPRSTRPGCAPIGHSTTASTRCAGIRTRCDHGRMSSTIRSTVTIAPRRAPSAPHTPSSSGGCNATLPARSAIGACSNATSGCNGASKPDFAERRCRRARKPSFASIDEPAIERVTIAGRPRAAGFESLREREERPVLDLDLAALVRAGEHGVGREVRKRVARVPGDRPSERDRRGRTSAPRLDSESITSVNCGSRPHHCRTTSRVAADQRAWPTTGCSTSPARTCSRHRVGERARLSSLRSSDTRKRSQSRSAATKFAPGDGPERSR